LLVGISLVVFVLVDYAGILVQRHFVFFIILDGEGLLARWLPCRLSVDDQLLLSLLVWLGNATDKPRLPEGGTLLVEVSRAGEAGMLLVEGRLPGSRRCEPRVYHFLQSGPCLLLLGLLLWNELVVKLLRLRICRSIY